MSNMKEGVPLAHHVSLDQVRKHPHIIGTHVYFRGAKGDLRFVARKDATGTRQCAAFMYYRYYRGFSPSIAQEMSEMAK